VIISNKNTPKCWSGCPTIIGKNNTVMRCHAAKTTMASHDDGDDDKNDDKNLKIAHL
jgi:hypothetical protein